jgi:signal transduction histidine kinase
MSTGARLATIYATLFALSTLLLGGVSLYLVNRAMHQQVDDRIAGEARALTQNLAPQSAQDILARIQLRKSEHPATHYVLRDISGDLFSGDVNWTGTKLGWFDFDQIEDSTSEEPDQFRAFAIAGDSYYLMVAEDTDEIENIRRLMFGTSAFLALIAAALAGGGGIWLSRFYLGKLETFARQARAITAGEHGQRMPLAQADDEFASLSTSLNLMLDRNRELLQQQRRVTGDIAHDIRTPLTRLRQKFEVDHSETATAAISEIDTILEILNAILRIAEIEEGDRRKNFKLVDLAEMANRVAEIYLPSFEDHGKHLTVYAVGPARVMGDPELLTQLLVNIVENALNHTPADSQTRIHIEQNDRHISLAVHDNGPGVPPGEEDNLLQRFYRLDKSRSTHGTGLGLNLVKAIADLHGAQVKIENLNPGLGVTIRLQKT